MSKILLNGMIALVKSLLKGLDPNLKSFKLKVFFETRQKFKSFFQNLLLLLLFFNARAFVWNFCSPPLKDNILYLKEKD